MTLTAAEVFRNYVTAGVPGSGTNQPAKSDISAWGTYLESLLNGSSAGLAYATVSLLSADLLHAANTLAIVYNDATSTNNGTYVKVGASGSGTWSRIGDLSNGIERLTVTGGTGNAIVATATETPTVPGAKLYLLTPTASNTTATTIVVNGAAAVPIKNAFSVDLASGSLVNGSQVLMAWQVDHYQLLISAVVDGSAILASCVAAENSASSSATAAASSASALGNEVHQYDTRALAIAATIPVGVQNVVVLREAAGYPLSRAPYIPGTSTGPRAFQEAGLHWWQLDISGAAFNVQWMGTKADGIVDDSVAFQGAINIVNANGGGDVFAPHGNYWLPGGIIVKAGVLVIGEGRAATTLQAYHTDITVVTLTGMRPGIRDLSIFGKGTNNDPGVFGATQNALVLSGSVEATVRDILVWGGAAALYTTAVDTRFNFVNAQLAYGSGVVVSSGADFYADCKFDHSPNGIAVTSSQPYANWTASTAVTVGKAVIVSGYAIQCSIAGTTGSAAPALKNYGVAMPDGTATWLLLAPSNFAGMQFGTSCGENHLSRCDFSGSGYTNSVLIDITAPFINGPQVIYLDHCIFSAQIDIMAAGLVSVDNCELSGNIELQPGYAGVTYLTDNWGAPGSIIRFDISAGVSDFKITGNYLSGGTIAVAAGASNHYVITGNIGPVVTDGGTGGLKSVTGNV